MSHFRFALRSMLAGVVVAVVVCLAHGQNPTQQEDVVKVETALVQTDVMVFDKQGKFVSGLKRDQFALKIDGKPRDISFLELVQAGTANEEAQLAAARGNTNSAGVVPVPLDRGRTVFFFIDDLHLAPDSVHRARLLMRRFVEREMGQNDQVAIISASGQIGFLQQLTDNKKVLLAAIERAQARATGQHDLQFPKMSEYQALRIDMRDGDVLDFFVDAVLRENPMMSRQIAEHDVTGRAREILHFAANATVTTLSSLRHLIDSASPVPGRKILFLLSDGFFVDTNNSDVLARVRETTSTAAATGLVIYSIDARGLTTGTLDASSPANIDTSGRLLRSAAGELPASQDGLNALAVDTGGRAFFNSNALSNALTTALKETSVYYLLAWRPDNEEQRSQKFRRLEVSVINRPELVVRFRRGFGELAAPEVANAKKKTVAEPPAPADDIRAALRSAYPKPELPVSVSLNFLNTPDRGDVVLTSVRIPTTSLQFEPQPAGLPTANITLAGVMLDDHGKTIDSFEKRITLRARSGTATAPPAGDVFYNNVSPARPGLYQVRVAALDDKRRRSGSNLQWIEVPDLSTKALALSGVFVSERKTEDDSSQANTPSNEASPAQNLFAGINLNIERRFKRSSFLRFLVFVYNSNSGSGAAAPGASNATQPASLESGAGRPDVAVQVQVFRDDEPVMTDPLHKINTDGLADLTRLPYAAELGLSSFQPGHYVLQLTVIDRAAKASASQRFRFEVD